MKNNTFLLILLSLIFLQIEFITKEKLSKTWVKNDTITGTHKRKQRRKFLKYVSSKWEQLWLDNIKQWENEKSLCHHINEQREQMQEFFYGTCTSRFPGTDWCYQDDTFEPFYVNTKTFEISTKVPDAIIELNSSNRHVKPEAHPFTFDNVTEDLNGIPAVFSKFVFYDEVTKTTFEEYIEPLVSHLRHPLARCRGGEFYIVKRHYVIPPPRGSVKGKNFYFDAGASTWKDGLGGPSLSYFTGVWLRHGIDFDYIRAWEGTTSSQTFYESVPEEYQNRTNYTQQFVAESAKLHTNTSNFIPTVIKELANEEDYVLFKLDIDHGQTEMGIVNHLLNSKDVHLIDEFVFEHHVEGNYLLASSWGDTISKNASIWDSYQLFLKMRNLGVRAHSWV